MIGRVVVVAGEDTSLAGVAAAAVEAGASVAVVSRTLPDDVAATVRFRADPGDRAAWERVAMHVEQHLGPVDGVVGDRAHADVLAAVFAADLARRGHGAVVTMTGGDEPAAVLTRLRGTPPAAPARPPAGDRGR
jgi:hypothetical protein